MDKNLKREDVEKLHSPSLHQTKFVMTTASEVHLIKQQNGENEVLFLETWTEVSSEFSMKVQAKITYEPNKLTYP